jgi:hypothetical protein
MNYLIQINGDVKGPFPIEKLIEEGVTKRTRVCLDGAEEWFFAEDIKELETIWEVKKVVPIKVIENKKEETQNIAEKVKDEESSKIEDKEKHEDLSGKAIKRMLLMGGIIIVLFFCINWIIGGDIPSDNNITSLKLTNAQEEYDKLIDEGYEYCKVDSLQNAFEKISTAAIVRRNYDLSISEKAQSIYEESLKKGDIAFGDGDIKELIPYALEFYEIANVANPTPEVEVKIQKCKSIQ